MGNIIDYVREYGAYSFGEKGICAADVLMLAQLSYLKFEGLVPTIGSRKQAVTIAEMDELMDPEVVFSDRRYEKQNSALWREVAGSRRYRHMKCDFYRTRLDEEENLQFAAVTFFPEGSAPVVAFRGTDENIVGWKEDFYLAFNEPIPAQKESAVYLQQVSAQLSADFAVCGHSKGGNLAIYASMLAEGYVQDRITDIFSFDGPGFRPEILSGASYENIKERVHRILPASSLVGMLLQNYEAYDVVKSSAFGVMQHDCYTWQIEGGKLVRLPDIEEKQKRMNEVLNRFIFSMTEEEMRLFVDTFFDVIHKTGAATVMDFAENWKQNIKTCLKEVRALDGETGGKIRQILRLLFEITADVNRHQGT